MPKLCNVADEETTTCNKKCRGLVEYIGLKPGRPHLSSTLPPKSFSRNMPAIGTRLGKNGVVDRGNKVGGLCKDVELESLLVKIT